MAVVHCGQCGTQNPAANTFCSSCGARLSDGVASAPSVQGKPAKKKASSRRRGCGCLLLLVVVGLIIAAVASSASRQPSAAPAPAATERPADSPTPADTAPAAATETAHQAAGAPVVPPTPAPSSTTVPSATPIPATDTPQPSDTPQDTETPAPTETPAISAHDSDGVVVTSSNFHGDNGTQYAAPSAGDQFAVVHLLIDNGSATQVSYNTLYFTLQSATTKTKYTAGAMDLNISDTLLGSGYLAPGQSTAGDIAFEIPADAGTYNLLWTPDVFSAPIYVPLRSVSP